MTDPIDMRREAIAVLFDEARAAARSGLDPSDFARTAPQWALDAITERQYQAIVEMAWRGLP